MLKYLILAFLASTVPFVTAKRGYVFLLTNTLAKSTTETMVLTLYDIPAPGTVTVSLLDNALNNTYQEVTTKVEKPSPADGQSIAIQFPVPAAGLQDGSAMIRIEGAFETEDKYSFNETNRVGLESHSDIVLIQTDQPIYKPGQKVRFRVIVLDYALKFLSEKKTADCWIENPSGIRVFQSNGHEVTEEIVQHEMQLFDQPSLGTYTITVNMTDTGVFMTQTFQVDEFVLPKFEVQITPPSYALFSDETVTVKICGKYTYGQLVNGNLTAVVTYESYSWDRDFERQIPKIRHNGPIEGCYNLTINQKELKWLNSTYRYRNMKVSATIIEDGTDVEQNATTNLKLVSDPLKVSFQSDGSYSQYFKPGLPINGIVSVTNPDDTPRPNELIQLCLVATIEARPSSSLYRMEKKLSCKNYTSNSEGLVHYTLPPGPSKMTQLKVQADAVNFPQLNNPIEPSSVLYYRPTNSRVYNQWYSPSNHFIQIEPIRGDAPCGETLNLKVLMTGVADDVFKVYVHVMSRGQIVMHTSVEQKFGDIKKELKVDDNFLTYDDQTSEYFKANDIESGSFETPILIRPEMAPKARVLFTYVLKDSGEIVADALDIPISKCLKNNVTMTFTSNKQYPGTKVGLQIKASPKSLCGISVVDKSLRLLSTNGQITQASALAEVEKLDNTNYYWYNNRRCNSRPGPFLPRYSDININRRKRSVIWRPGGGYSSKADSTTAVQKSKVIVVTDLTLETKPCERDGYLSPPMASGGYIHTTAYAYHAPMPTRTKMRLPAARPQVLNEVSKVGFVQEDAVRGGGLGGASATLKPVKEVRVEFPETWLWDIVTVDENGEAVSKPTLPDTITEWQGNAVCINQADGLGVSPTASVTGFQPFFVSYTLPYSIIRGEISPVIVSVFNYLDKCLPVALTLDQTEEFTLQSESLNQTLCVCGGKSATYTYLVKPKILGQLNFTVRAYTVGDSTICGDKKIDTVSARDAATNSLIVEPEGFKRDVTISSFFCPAKDGANLKTHLDLEAPTNLVEGSLKAYFSVCGDLMGPTLKNIDKLIQMPTGCGEQNMISFVPDILILDYLKATNKLTPELNSKLLNYIQAGYQRELTYRHVDGSYSAFGQSDKEGSIWLSAFVVKSFKAASKYVPVDEQDISRTTAYITSQQQKNGCFPEVGEVHHKAMKGGVDSAKGSKVLTAYILAALLESEKITNESLASGLECLATESDPPTYTLAINTYASCLAGSPVAKERLDALLKKAVRKDGIMYWEDELTHSKSIQIEIASYAVLSLLQECGGKNLTTALEIVKFISNNRNGNGGFYSTQDTVMALQALSTYGSLISQDPVDIKINAVANGLKEEFKVNEENKLLVQSVKVPEVPSPLEVEGSGTGCGLVQTNLKYNVLDAGNQAGFTLDVTPSRGAANSCKKATLTFCMGYEEEGKAAKSNMALLDIRLVSGYVLDVESIPPLRDDPELSYKRYDVNGNNVALYFNQVSAKKCFSIALIQEFEVQDTKPGTVKLFDYYNTEKQIAKEYKIDSNCP